MSCKRFLVILKNLYTNNNNLCTNNNNLCTNKNSLIAKDCKTCVYYQNDPIEFNSLCLRFGKEKEDKITGINFFTTKAMRQDTSRCGPDAYYHRRPFNDI